MGFYVKGRVIYQEEFYHSVPFIFETIHQEAILNALDPLNMHQARGWICSWRETRSFCKDASLS